MGAERPRRPRGRRALVAALLAVPLALVMVACDQDEATPQASAPSASTPAGPVVEGTPVAPSSAAGEGTSSPDVTDGPTTGASTQAPGKAPATVPPVERPRATSVGLGSEAEPAPGLTARLVTVEPVDGTAEGPGEIAGDALRVTVELVNGTDRSVDLRGAVVNLYTGKDRLPTSELAGPGVVALPADVARGKKVSATYVFRTDDRSGRVEVEVDIADAPSIVVFRGTP